MPRTSKHNEQVKTVKLIMPYIPKTLEALKGEVSLKPERFPKLLGEKHPFDFKLCEDTYANYGLFKAAVDKTIDLLVSPGFYVESDDKNAQAIITKFITETNFENHLRSWIKDALVKGNGFMEVAIDKTTVELKVLDAKSLYVNRSKKGKIEGYTQFVGDLNRFDINKTIAFDPQQIAHLPIDQIGDCAYGIGMGYPSLRVIDNLLQSERDEHLLLKRKANSPIHAKLGTPEQPVSADDVAAAGEKLVWLNNLHEWATDHLWEFKVIDFGQIGDKFTATREHDVQMLFYIWQIPPVIMGSAYQNEGIASVQEETLDRRIKSIQAQVESIIEEKIFKVILEANGIASHVEMHWGRPSDDKINARLERLVQILGNIALSPELRAMIEKDIAKNLGYDEKDIDLIPDPETRADIEREKELALKQPEVPGAKPSARESYQIKNNASPELYEMTKSLTIKEWVNFDYLQYKKEVIRFIREDNFSDLRGRDERDFALGKLTPAQIEQLKNILIDVFEKNGSINEIVNQLSKLNLKDRYTIDSAGRRYLIMDKELRREAIARSEVTRVASGGLLNHYESQGISRVRFLASISQRTCPICEDLNGQIFKLTEALGVIPVHPMCRCSWVSINDNG